MALPKNVIMPLTWVMDVARYLKSRPLDDYEAYDLYLDAEAKLQALIDREDYIKRMQKEKESR